jgi:capsular polysaccharide export protein
MRRSFLALQGTASPFFRQLAEALRSRGHAVKKVNFCGGDLLYDLSGQPWNYRGKAAELESWYRDVIATHMFTDVLMFGDCREIHRPVHSLAQAAGVRVHVFEEGYVRPHWLTMEQYGVNGRSLLSRDPTWYLDQRSATPVSPPGVATGYNLYARAFHDIVYRGANATFASHFPHYQTHRPRNGFVEYSGLAARLLCKSRYQRESEDVTRALLANKQPYYLFPLQLNSDAQIVVHSPFSGVCEAIESVLRSFARHSPADSLLVIKNHPMDTGLIDYRGLAKRLSEELDIAERLRFIDAGHLPTLLECARGVVVVNSTVGLTALHHRRPLIALGSAIYDMAGLTWQGTLGDFWASQERPDADVYQSFLDYIVHHTQINGDFYTRNGIEMAVAGAVRRLEAIEHA